MTPTIPEPREHARFIEFAKDQPEYRPLPANFLHPYVETKWKLSWRERIKIVFSGNLYLTVMTFGQPLQPIRMSVLRDAEL